VSDLVDLSQCIVDGDSREIGRAKRVRGRAVAASITLETAVVAGLLLWPLLNPAVLPSQPILTPVPVFHSAPKEEIVRATQPPHTQEPRPSVFDRTLHQPPQIPSHVDTSGNNEPPIEYGNVMPSPFDGPGSGIGDGTEVTQIARPGPSSHPDRPIQRSSGVMEALLIHRVQPDYPQVAKEIHLSGNVELRAIIGTDGIVENIEVVSGNPILANAAIAAVKQWRYQPTRLSGIPVEVETIITVQFRME